jgi:hypothetical protein
VEKESGSHGRHWKWSRVKMLLGPITTCAVFLLFMIIVLMLQGPITKPLPDQATVETKFTESLASTRTQELDEIGEPVDLLLPASDKPVAREDGIDLSDNPEYIAEMQKIYSPEDLERLFAPRKWVIIPNVVGMTKDEAIKTFQAVGLVGHVMYVDRAGEEGTCIAQDIAAGQRWNTDAAIILYIQRREKKSDEQSSKGTEETPKQEDPDDGSNPGEEETPDETDPPESSEPTD